MENLIYILDLIGTFTFAISGSLSAANKKLDLFGALFTAAITALGGGTLRDLLIGNTPVTWMNDLNYLLAVAVAVALAFFFTRFIQKRNRTLLFFDAIGIGVFTIIGVNKALMFNIHPAVAVIMGMITAVMGGILRDTFVNDIPLILHKEIYATACLAGASLFLLLNHLNVNSSLNSIITILFIIAVRLLSVKFEWSLPVIHTSGDKKNKTL